MEIKNCTLCNASIEYSYVNCYNEQGELIEVHCHNCEKARNLEKYLESFRLSESLITNTTLDLYDIGCPWDYNNPPRHKTIRAILEGPYSEILMLKTKIDIYLSYTNISTEIKRFESMVWFNGLQKIIRNSSNRKISAKCKDLKCLTFSMCARTMITLENEENSVTMMCTEDSEESTMHFRSIDATEDQAIDLIDTCIKLFVEGKLEFEEDNDISYCGV